MLLIHAHQSRMWNNGQPPSRGISSSIYTTVHRPFCSPREPGPYSCNPGPNPYSRIHNELTRTHTENMCIFREYKNIDMACKKLITNLANEVYYRTLKVDIRAM